MIAKRGFYVLKDDPKWKGEKEAIFNCDRVFGPSAYCRSHKQGNMITFTPWEHRTLMTQAERDILNTEFDYYESWESIPKAFGIPFLDVAPLYTHEKGRKLHRSSYFKMYIIQDFLKENGWDYSKMSDEAILTVIKRYKGWVEKGFPKSLKSILQKINDENPKV